MYHNLFHRDLTNLLRLSTTRTVPRGFWTRKLHCFNLKHCLLTKMIHKLYPLFDWQIVFDQQRLVSSIKLQPIKKYVSMHPQSHNIHAKFQRYLIPSPATTSCLELAIIAVVCTQYKGSVKIRYAFPSRQPLVYIWCVSVSCRKSVVYGLKTAFILQKAWKCSFHVVQSKKCAVEAALSKTSSTCSVEGRGCTRFGNYLTATDAWYLIGVVIAAGHSRTSSRSFEKQLILLSNNCFFWISLLCKPILT